MDNNDFNIAPLENKEEEFFPMETDVSQGITAPPVEEDVAKRRASKYSFALGDKSPGEENLLDRIISGMEDSDRERYALEKTAEYHDTRIGLIKDLSENASNQGRDLSQAEMQTVLDLSQADIDKLRVDPRTFFEREFARKVISHAIETGEDTPYANALNFDANATAGKLDVFEDVVTMKEAYQHLAEEMDAQVKNQSMIGYSADFLKEFASFGFYSWYKDHNFLAETPGSPFLPGDNMADQIRYAYTGNPDERIPQVINAIREIAKDNPQLAQRLAHNLVDYPSSAKLMDNIWGVVNVASVLPFGLMAKGAKTVAGVDDVIQSAELRVANQYKKFDLGRTASNVKDTIIDTSKEVAKDPGAALNKTLSKIGSVVTRRNPTVPEVLDAAGNADASALASVLDKIKTQYTTGATNDVGWRDLINEVAGLANPNEVVGGIVSTEAKALTQNILEQLIDQSHTGLKALFLDMLKTGRVGPEALKAALDAAKSTFLLERRDLENAIMNVFEDNLDTNLGTHKAIIHLGAPDATPFTSEETAKNIGIIYFGGQEDAFRVVPVGNRWALQIERPFDFTLDGVREAMKIDAKNNPVAWSNTLGRMLASLRSTDDVLPKAGVEKLKIATYGASGLEKAILSMAKGIGRLKDPKYFLNFLESEKLEKNPLNPNKLGMYSRNQAELDMKWMQRFNRPPTEQESRAYWTYKQINDLHYMALNLSLYLDKMAAGLSNLVIKGLGDMLVEGKVVGWSQLENISKDFNPRVLVLEDGKEPRFVSTRYNMKDEANPDSDIKQVTRLKQMVQDEGYILTQISDTGDDTIKNSGFFDEIDAKVGRSRINFVITRKVDAQPLSIKQVPYQMGGHNITPDGWYISQPKMGFDKDRLQATYYGDTNYMFAANEKLGKKMAENFETARKMLLDLKATAKKVDPIGRAEKIKALKAFAKKNLPISYSQLIKDFGPKGYLDINLPVMARASNQNLNTAYPLANIFPKADFVVHAQSPLNLYRGHVNLEFATDRGLPVREVVNRGDALAPVFGLRPVSLLDPMAALDRGINAMVRGRYFEPMKLDIARMFYAEFGDLISLADKDVAADPFRAIQEMAFKEGVQGTDIERLRLARAYAARANQFFGTAVDPGNRYFNYLGQKLLKGDFPESQSSFRLRLAEILQDKHPAEIIKKLAFHPKMGFWNPKQMLQQGITAINTVAIVGPKLGYKAIVYSMVHNFVDMAPGKLTAEGAKLVEKMGFSAEDFLKVSEAMKRTGFHQMGREVATREQHLNFRVVQTILGGMLDSGLYFMRRGEEFVRRTAFYAAYMEKAAQKGTMNLTDKDLASVLNRADFLNVNMSHASNAAWQQGLTGIPTQFWSYQIRLFEQMVGKRMTNAEKARLLTTYSLIFGAPVAGTMLMPFWPMHESIKEYLISKNIAVDDNLLVKTVNDGMLSMFTELFLGEKTNINTIYGPVGISLIKDIADGRKDIIDAIGGASGNVLFNVAAGLAPSVYWISRAITGHDVMPLTMSDFTNVLTNVTSFSMAQKAYIAMTTGGYLTKYGDTIGTDNNQFRMFVETVLGIQPEAIDDMYAKMQVNKDMADYKTKINRAIKDNIRNMLNATTDEDKEKFAKRAQVNAELLGDEWAKREALNNAYKDNGKTLIDEASERHSRASDEARDYEFNYMNSLEGKTQ